MKLSGTWCRTLLMSQPDLFCSACVLVSTQNALPYSVTHPAPSRISYHASALGPGICDANIEDILSS